MYVFKFFFHFLTLLTYLRQLRVVALPTQVTYSTHQTVPFMPRLCSQGISLADLAVLVLVQTWAPFVGFLMLMKTGFKCVTRDICFVM